VTANTAAEGSQIPNWDDVPFFRKNWVVAIAFLLCIPVALLICWTGPVYEKRQGQIREMSQRNKIVFTVIAVGLLIFFILPNLMSDSCSESEVRAQVLSVNAALTEKIGEHPGIDYTRSVAALTAATSRIQAALMRGDTDAACKISKDLQQQMAR
jgi:hypothetical protein